MLERQREGIIKAKRGPLQGPCADGDRLTRHSDLAYPSGWWAFGLFWQSDQAQALAQQVDLVRITERVVQFHFPMVT